MFSPDGDTRTFGEMPPEAKYAISHRTRAFEAFKRDCLEHVKANAPAEKSGRDFEALDAAARNLSTQAELVKFIASLREDFAANRMSWKTDDLAAFLVALERAASTADASGHGTALAHVGKNTSRGQPMSNSPHATAVMTSGATDAGGLTRVVSRDDPGFGVYIHWPFCAQKCPYCDFNSHVRFGGWDEAALSRSLQTRAEQRREPPRHTRNAPLRRSSSAAARHR